MSYSLRAVSESWSRSQAVYKPVWHTPLLFAQWKTPDDGQRNYPKHAEFHSKNKFEKLLHLKVMFSRYWPGVAQRVGRGIALFYHDRGTRRGWVVSSTPRPHLSPGKTQYPFYRRLCWPQGRSGRAEKSRPHRDSIADRPARSQSLYRLSYTAHN
jgi:hypothetical protein